MKNQYFGDNRDLFKYDLIFQIIKKGLVSHFIFIPMLTPDVSDSETTKREGEQRNRCKAKAGWKNNDLSVFLDKFQDKAKRDIRELTSFFKRQDVGMTIYCGKDEYFSHQQRREYFAQIGDELLTKSLIFVDPDIGLEVKRSREKHILYSEVERLYERMDKSSILMIYQHFPREDHHEYLHWRSEELKNEITGDEPICIDNDEIIFFFLTKDESLEHSLVHLISDYAERYSR